MTHKEIIDVINGITYKPEVEIKALIGQWDNIRVTFRHWPLDAESKDSRNIRRIPITYSCDFRPDYFQTKEHVLAMIYDRVIELETHEVREWLKHNGEHIRDPHPEPNP